MKIAAPYSLAHYEAIAKLKPMNELTYAAKDIAETLAIYRESDQRDPYTAKLWAEFDAYTVEMQRRRRLAIAPKRESASLQAKPL